MSNNTRLRRTKITMSDNKNKEETVQFKRIDVDERMNMDEPDFDEFEDFSIILDSIESDAHIARDLILHYIVSTRMLEEMEDEEEKEILIKDMRETLEEFNSKMESLENDFRMLKE